MTWRIDVQLSDEQVSAPNVFSLLGLKRIIWVFLKIMVRFWIPIIIRHPIFRVLQKGSSF